MEIFSGYRRADVCRELLDMVYKAKDFIEINITTLQPKQCVLNGFAEDAEQ